MRIPRTMDKLQAQLDRHRRKVDVEPLDVSTRELTRMAEEKELARAPTYQRKFRWTLEAESLLIESLMLGLPVPSIFVATNEDGSWELVDGLQRVSTLLHFVDPTPETLKQIGRDEALRLTGLIKLSSFNTKTFSELPTAIKLHFMKRTLRVTSLSDKSDKSVRFDLFERLNRGAVALSAQEVRACVYRGRFIDFLRELAGLEDFNRLIKLQKKRRNDGTAEELVLKFFAYLNGRDEFNEAVEEFLTSYTKQATVSFDFEEGREIFLKVVAHLRSLSDGPILRRGYHLTPLNQFEAIMVGAAEVLRRGEALRRPPDGWLNDEELVATSTKGTNTRASLEGRIRRAGELLSTRRVRARKG